jgi:hypothetical protein
MSKEEFNNSKFGANTIVEIPSLNAVRASVVCVDFYDKTIGVNLNPDTEISWFNYSEVDIVFNP